MTLNISVDNLHTIVRAIDEAVEGINSSEDIRQGVVYLGTVEKKIRSWAELQEAPESRFVSLLVYVMVGHARTQYAEKEDEWYNRNKANIDAYKKVLSEFLRALRSAFQSANREKIIDACQAYFFEFHKLSMLTAD